MEKAINTAEAFTEDSFKITGRGIVLELKHQQEGLPKGTSLIAPERGKSWEVKARILFSAAADQQRVFEVEHVEFALLSFSDQEKRKQSIANIRAKEAENIYQYLIPPIDHDDKPEHGEKLTITLTPPVAAD